MLLKLNSQTLHRLNEILSAIEEFDLSLKGDESRAAVWSILHENEALQLLQLFEPIAHTSGYEHDRILMFAGFVASHPDAYSLTVLELASYITGLDRPRVANVSVSIQIPEGDPQHLLALCKYLALYAPTAIVDIDDSPGL